MFIPKVIFRYAYPLDLDRRTLYESKGREYPSAEVVKEKTKEVTAFWEEFNKEDKIVASIIEILGVTIERDIECYVIGAGFNMSVPFIISISDLNGFKDNDQTSALMVHELCHMFAAGMNPNLRKYWKHIYEKYPDEPPRTRNHIIVYGVVQIILKELFSEEKMRELIKVDALDYQRAIDIVDEAGSEAIIKEFRDLTHE